MDRGGNSFSAANFMRVEKQYCRREAALKKGSSTEEGEQH
jgi:hypothetical protein